MAKTFGDAERHILSLFNIGSTFKYNNIGYTVINSGKPTCSKGEPKTDIYIAAKDAHCNIIEFKISFKNKMQTFSKIRPMLNEPNNSLVVTGVILFLRPLYLLKMNFYLDLLSIKKNMEEQIKVV